VTQELQSPSSNSMYLPLAIVGIALFIAVFDNTVLFKYVFQSTQLDEQRLAIVATMFALVTCTLGMALAVVAP